MPGEGAQGPGACSVEERSWESGSCAWHVRISGSASSGSTWSPQALYKYQIRRLGLLGPELRTGTPRDPILLKVAVIWKKFPAPASPFLLSWRVGGGGGVGAAMGSLGAEGGFPETEGSQPWLSSRDTEPSNLG